MKGRYLFTAITVSILVAMILVFTQKVELPEYKIRNQLPVYTFEDFEDTRTVEVGESGIGSSRQSQTLNPGGLKNVKTNGYKKAEDAAWCTMRSMGFSPVATAAIMGNIQAESSWNPMKVQDSGGKGRYLFQLDNGDLSSDGDTTTPRRLNCQRMYVKQIGGTMDSVYHQIRYLEYALLDLEKHNVAGCKGRFYEGNKVFKAIWPGPCSYEKKYKLKNENVKVDSYLYAAKGTSHYARMEQACKIRSNTSIIDWNTYILNNNENEVDGMAAIFMMVFERPTTNPEKHRLVTRRIKFAEIYLKEYPSKEDSLCRN